MQEQLFRDGHLSIGIVLPMKSDEGRTVDFVEQVELAVLAEELGFSAVWVRDVPLNGPWYPEPFGHSDPMVMLGALAARTSTIALGTAAIVLPLRDPLHIAKAATSLDHLSRGRFILGLGSGDRPEEYAAFGAEFDQRKLLYREHWARLAAALERPPRVLVNTQDQSDTFELRPPAGTNIAMIAIGSGGQSLEWIGRNAAGWATYHRPRMRQRDRYNLWRRAVDRVAPGTFRSFSVALYLQLDDDPNAPARDIELGYRTGAADLSSIFKILQQDGVHHVMLNLAVTGASLRETLGRIAERVP